ncbi:ASCH domain-containing protein [Glycomyces tenuis]|uniref:ASCH domain-containing protein n=1 Tax=Glycomyces tenuis TaxID=58116 RepID=UPI000425DDF9|nr:ASCH domain-containing protein [Glycomyces tenuis]
MTVTVIRALTVRQPWAHLIARGGKTVENRTRRTHWRGPVLIHAAKTLPVAQWARARGRFGQSAVPEREALPLGAVVAVADLTECHGSGWPWRCNSGACARWGDHGPETWHWVLANVRPLLDPIPARGQLGLWTPANELAAAVATALPAKEDQR